jgi:N-acetylneuraminate synthase
VAEIAQAHDGSLGMAHAFISAAASSGADAVKFQTHLAEHESTRAEPWRVQFSVQDATRYDYWRRMEFTEEQWMGLKRHAEEVGLLFLSSPFSMAAMDLLERVGVAAWKVPSGEVGNIPMLRRMAKSNLPVMVSSGMSDVAEIDQAVAILVNKEVCLLQCSTTYPTRPEHVGLNVLQLFRERYPGIAVGLSDHSATIYPALAAVILEAQVVEVHLTLSKTMYGPDVTSSLTPNELKQLVEGTRFVDTMRRSPVDKFSLGKDQEEMRHIFTKSAVAARDLVAGETIEETDIALKKPGGGISPSEYHALVGRQLARPVKLDEQFTWDDVK